MFSIVAFVVLVAGVTAANIPQIRLDPNITSDRTRIINGDLASSGEFPHQLTLLRSNSHICGASVIAANWVLTAAHCVDGQTASSFSIAGNFINFNSPGSYFIYDVQEIIKHPNYNSGAGAFPNDVALLRLASSVDLSSYKVAVAQNEGNFVGETCQISGWGLMENGAAASELMKADVRVLSKAECVSSWGSNNIQDQHICVIGDGDAYPNGAGSCNGDSGGPLTCRSGKVLAGLTSWGRSGCHTNGVVTYPSVYARTTTFYTWINSNCGNCL